MPSRRSFLFSVAGAACCVSLPSLAKIASHPASATAITKVFGDGVRFVAVALEFPVAIDDASLSREDFSIVGRTVTDVYAATSANPADRAGMGRFVIIALSPDDAKAPLLDTSKQHSGPTPGKKAGAGGMPKGGVGKAGEKPARGYDMYFLSPEATVEQVRSVRDVSGRTVKIPAAETDRVENLVVDDFRQLSYTDPKTGDTLKYNLFVPKAYDPEKRYPLVLFMHDAGATNTVTRTTLFQGLGAICWARPEDQAKRPCFVLAPQYDTIITDDESRASGMLDTTLDLIRSLTKTYSIDRNRLYATGQSGGCMMSIAMNIRYPDFFAASFLVAGQWDPKLVAPIAGNRLWILVSQDDFRAFPGENAITKVLEEKGAKIARAVWDGRWSAGQFRAAFDKIDARHCPINYVTFARGTVIPPGGSTAGASGHRNTWRIAYTIEPIREWIFRHRK